MAGLLDRGDPGSAGRMLRMDQVHVVRHKVLVEGRTQPQVSRRRLRSPAVLVAGLQRKGQWNATAGDVERNKQRNGGCHSRVASIGSHQSGAFARRAYPRRAVELTRRLKSANGSHPDQDRLRARISGWRFLEAGFERHSKSIRHLGVFVDEEEFEIVLLEDELAIGQEIAHRFSRQADFSAWNTS